MKKITSLILALVMALSLTTAAFATETTITGATKNPEGKYTNKGTVTITTGGAASETTGTVGDSWKITVPASLESKDAPSKTDYKTVAANYYVVVNWDVESSIVFKANGDGYSWVVTDKDDQQGALAQKDISGAYESANSTWAGNATVKVTVTNLSNRIMYANTAFAPETGFTFEENSVTVDKATLTLATATDKLDDTTTKVTFENAPSDTATVTIPAPKTGTLAADGDAIGYVTVTVTAEAEA